jgi:hypothetical protein
VAAETTQVFYYNIPSPTATEPLASNPAIFLCRTTSTTPTRRRLHLRAWELEIGVTPLFLIFPPFLSFRFFLFFFSSQRALHIPETPYRAVSVGESRPSRRRQAHLSLVRITALSKEFSPRVSPRRRILAVLSACIAFLAPRCDVVSALHFYAIFLRCCPRLVIAVFLNPPLLFFCLRLSLSLCAT